MVAIDRVAFGSIIIDGTRYTSDLVIYPDGRVIDNWWRTSGHRLLMGDIADLVAESPEAIVAGCGARGMMRPDPELSKTLAKKGIDFFADQNDHAIRIFNRVSQEKRVGACFHLTC